MKTTVEKVRHGWGRVEDEHHIAMNGGDLRWTEGVVYSPHGLVSVYSHPTSRGYKAMARIVIILHGMVYEREIQKYYKSRYLRRLAYQFAEEVASGNIRS